MCSTRYPWCADGFLYYAKRPLISSRPVILAVFWCFLRVHVMIVNADIRWQYFTVWYGSPKDQGHWMLSIPMLEGLLRTGPGWTPCGWSMGSSISTGLANPECTGKQPRWITTPTLHVMWGCLTSWLKMVFLMRILSVLRDSRPTPCPNTGSPQRRKSRPYNGEEIFEGIKAIWGYLWKVQKCFDRWIREPYKPSRPC